MSAKLGFIVAALVSLNPEQGWEKQTYQLLSVGGNVPQLVSSGGTWPFPVPRAPALLKT